MPAEPHPAAFPKSRRILPSGDFRKVYDGGSRFSCPLFAAFYLVRPDQSDGPKVGFTASRAMGKAVTRNRLKRRLREAVRRYLNQVPPRFLIVFNPRKPVLRATTAAIESEVQRLFRLCAAS